MGSGNFANTLYTNPRSLNPQQGENMFVQNESPQCIWCDRSDGTHSVACARATAAEERLKLIAPLADDPRARVVLRQGECELSLFDAEQLLSLDVLQELDEPNTYGIAGEPDGEEAARNERLVQTRRLNR